jgi:putative acetyltransferase
VTIRPERAGDAGAIRAVLTAAFETSAEADLVERLRADGDLVLALVAEHGGAIRGTIAFARLRIDTAKAVGLAPLAVMPDARRQGIGGALVREGLRLLAAQDEQLIFVLGAPAYYRRFGFDRAAARAFACKYAGDHFMALRVGDNAPLRGEVRYPAAFDGPG